MTRLSILRGREANGPPVAHQRAVFVFFSNRLVCLGSLALSVVLSGLLILLMLFLNGFFSG